MKILRHVVVSFALFLSAASPSLAQWQTTNHSTPLGRGPNIIGFGSVGPCPTGQVQVGVTGNDPVCAQIGTNGIQNGAVTYALMQNESASTILCNPTGSAQAPAECSLGAGLKFTGSQVVNTVPNSFQGVSGLLLTNDATTPNSVVDITANQASLQASGQGLYLTNVSLVVNTGNTGANGLDTGSRAVSTWYNFFIISNGSTTAGLASLSATSPTMPSGYTYAFRVGAMRTDSSGNFLRTRQVGQVTKYLTTIANQPTITSGNNSSTYTAQSVTSFVPPTAVSIFVGTWCQSNGVGASYLGIAGFQAGTAPSTQPFPEWEFEVNGGQVLMANGTTEVYFPTSTQQIFYSSIAMSSSFAMAYGWRDAVNAN